MKASGPSAEWRVHMDWRLHQLMHEDMDYEVGMPLQVELGDQFCTRAALFGARKSWMSPSSSTFVAT